MPALTFIFAALALLLLVFQFTASIQYAALATVLAMGVFAFGNVPGLQVYVVQKAEQYAPHAVDVASGLNIAAFNVGIALGSVIGGQTVARGGLAQTPWIGAVIVAVALLLITLSGRLDRQPVRCWTEETGQAGDPSPRHPALSPRVHVLQRESAPRLLGPAGEQVTRQRDPYHRPRNKEHQL